MSTQYLFSNPPQHDAVGGDPLTGTVWSTSFEAARLALYNAVMAQVAGEIDILKELVGITSADTLRYRWASDDAIIVEPGKALNGGKTFEVVNETTLSLDADLDTGTRQANVIYFVWIGEDTISGDTKLKISLSGDTPPTCLVSTSAYRLRHFFNTLPSNSNIERFDNPLPDDWPVGLYAWDGPCKPAGCHWAHGQEVSRTHPAYQRLFARYSPALPYGAGDGSTTFGLPDMRGRSPMGSGQGSGLPLVALGETLGEWEHQLTVDEMPSHGPHKGYGGICPKGNYYYGMGGESGIIGGDQPHNTVHPVLVCNFIIKA